MNKQEPLLLLPPPAKLLQKRYYSLREVYRKHAIYSKKNGSKIYQEYLRCLRVVHQYLEWLKSKSLTIYVVNKDHIKEFIEYFISYERPVKGVYSKQTLLRKFAHFYHFNEWLFQEKIIEENLFDSVWYRNLRREVKSRDHPFWLKKVQYEVPEVFQKAYEAARKMDRQLDYHPETMRIHNQGWSIFLTWLYRQGVVDIRKVAEPELINYAEHLKKVKSEKTGHILSAYIVMRRLVAVKILFSHLACSLVVKRDPSYVIHLPKTRQAIPRALMSRREVEKLLEMPDINTLVGIRDKAIFELFYSTAVRRNELSHIKVEDILFKEGLVRVMFPKGGISFQRVVPIGHVALEWVRRYLNEVRHRLIGNYRHDYLFVNESGRSLTNRNIGILVKNYCYQAGFRKPITSHSFRVTCATEMLRNRADIRYVQAHLGHNSIQSTQVYARVLPIDLKKVHQRTHPRERRLKSDQKDLQLK